VPASALAALDIVDSAEGAALRRALQEKTALFVRRLQGAGHDLLGTESQIVPVLTREPKPTMSAMARLLEEGYYVQGIRPPTVPTGLCRLRATVMATHQNDDLLLAAEAINRAVAGVAGG
jgi:7-keto-8-aminopelargonate synthetase-like enzyme